MTDAPVRPGALAEAASAFLLEPGTAFLNHGSYGATPRPVLDAQQAWRERLESNPVRFLLRELWDHLDAARDTCAAFLGADPEGLVFVANATTGVNAVVRSLPLAPGDEILTTDHTYPSIIHTLRRVAAASGATVRVVPIPLPLPDDDTITSAILAAVTVRTRLAVIDHITSATGARFPIERIVAGLRDAAVPVCVDAAHSPGLVDIDLTALAPDFWTANWHKWVCAPKGAGALWVSERYREHVLAPITSLPFYDNYRQRFGYLGTSDPTPWLSVPAALAFMHEVGWDDLRTYGHALATWGRSLLAEDLGTAIPVRDDATLQMGLIELPAGTIDSVDDGCTLNRRLYDEFRVEIPVTPWGGRGFLRISAQCTTTADDIERLRTAVQALIPR